MPLLALTIFALYVVLAFGIRTVVHLRRTGDSGFRAFSDTTGSAAWWAGVLFITALIGLVLGLVAALVGLPDVPLLDRDWIHLLGLGLAAVGIVGTFLTQLAMGASWRVGVDQTEHTALVTTGPFQLVRNPIFTAMLLAAIEFEVRAVEEPHLRHQHGEPYQCYTARVGRFIPGIGVTRGG